MFNNDLAVNDYPSLMYYFGDEDNGFSLVFSNFETAFISPKNYFFGYFLDALEDYSVRHTIYSIVKPEKVFAVEMSSTIGKEVKVLDNHITVDGEPLGEGFIQRVIFKFARMYALNLSYDYRQEAYRRFYEFFVGLKQADVDVDWVARLLEDNIYIDNKGRFVVGVAETLVGKVKVGESINAEFIPIGKVENKGAYLLVDFKDLRSHISGSENMGYITAGKRITLDEAKALCESLWC